jgi:hypothetical protein
VFDRFERENGPDLGGKAEEETIVPTRTVAATSYNDVLERIRKCNALIHSHVWSDIQRRTGISKGTYKNALKVRDRVKELNLDPENEDVQVSATSLTSLNDWWNGVDEMEEANYQLSDTK